jgi:hypothetical protein
MQVISMLSEREIHGADVDDRRLVGFALNTDDFLDVVLSAVVPFAMQFGGRDGRGLVDPLAGDSQFHELRLGLCESDVEGVFVKGFHGFRLVLFGFNFGLELVSEGGHLIIISAKTA